MTKQNITTTGSGKGAQSTSTDYTAADKAAIAAATQAVTLQQNSKKVATLKKANEALKASLNQVESESFIASNHYRTPQDTVTYDTSIIAYIQTMIVANKWGADVEKNDEVYTIAYCTGAPFPGTAITVHDAGVLADVVTNSANKSGYLYDLNVAKKQIQDVNTKIAANQKIIDATPTSVSDLAQQAREVGVGGSGGSGGTGKGSKASLAVTNSQTTTPQPPPENPTPDYLWNLPPHAWSLPIDPQLVNFLGNEQVAIDKNGERLVDTATGDFNVSSSTNTKNNAYHTNRLGKIWFYNGYAGTSAALDYASGGQYAGGGGTGSTGVSKASTNKYGFQFMWNPETYNQTTSVNMSITPSNTDPTIALTGFAAANSQMSFTLRIDRTNDFACAKKLVPGNVTKSADLSKFAEYYVVGNRDSSYKKDVSEKLLDLLNYGTESDLEYLYRVINGDTWVGIGGRKTANIGYLMPALIRVDLGNQKFVGVVTSLSVDHLAFTGDMVPIRSDVSVGIDLRANIQPTTNLTAPATPTPPATK